MSRALLLFARSPEMEARCKGLPLRDGAALFHRIAQLWSEAAKAAGANLFLSTNEAGWAVSVPGAVVLEQREAAFGVRLADSVEQVFAAGATAMIVAGIDTPPIPSILNEAFLYLERHRDAAVIGPARDGGIYLLGLTRPDRDLLEGIKPRQHDVVEHCRRFLRGSTLLLLPVVSDLDSLRDARRLAQSSEIPWIRFHSLLASMFSRTYVATNSTVLLTNSGESLGSRAPPSV